MKLSTCLFTVGTAATAVAAAIEAREGASIKSVITNVQNNIDKVTAACENFNGDIVGGVDIVNNLIKSISDGIATANASAALSLRDSLSLRPATNTLRDSAQKLYGA